jgi:hypothetical protein
MGRWDPAAIWDGSQIVEPSAPTLTPRRWNPMFVVANLFAIGAAVLLFLYFRERRAGSS